MAVGTPLSMAKAPAAASPTQQTRAVSSAASAQRWKGAPGRALSTGGVFGQMGKLPNVSAVGGGKTTRAAALPTPLPPPGGMMKTQSVQDVMAAWDRRNIEFIKQAVDWKKLLLRTGKRKQPLRSAEELMSQAPKHRQPALRGVPPARGDDPFAAAVTRSADDPFAASLQAGPRKQYPAYDLDDPFKAAVTPRPNVKRTAADLDADDFFGGF